ncbi:RDD family protein [Arsenicicoccus dermatophilus]|uniref:RDD family protein n=1 Tax=Arsenicicoccus dermatophilus TaxID=1076331 RepID=UPI003917154C
MTQPSGWYDDPQDPAFLRYFDGVTWTDHRAPKVAPQVQRSTIGEGQRAEDFHRPVGQGPAGASPYVVPSAQGSYGTDSHGQSAYGSSPQQSQVPAGYGQAYAASPVAPDGQPLAGWWRRVGANLLDSLLLSLLTVPLALGLLRDWIPEVQAWMDQVAAQPETTTTMPAVPQPDTTTLLQVGAVTLAVFFVYEIGCLSRWGRTLGRAATGISVRRVEAPLTVPFGRLAARTVVKRLGDLVPIPLLGMLFSLVDVLWPLGDGQRQALHDKAGRTLVVRGRVARGDLARGGAGVDGASPGDDGPITPR